MADKRYIHELSNGSFLECDVDEIAEAISKQQLRTTLEETIARCQKELEDLTRGCTHPVTWDEDGYIYHIRKCVICGHQSITGLRRASWTNGKTYPPSAMLPRR